MTKGRTRTRNTKNKLNPVFRQITRIGRPTMKFDGAVVSSTTYLGSPQVVANIAKGVLSIDCDSASNLAVTAGASQAVASGVLNLYSEYRYNNCAVEWIPSIGPTNADAGSRIHIAYIDNPEKMTSFQAVAAAGALNLVRGCKNVRTFNAWERFTYRVPLTWRRKVFDTNVSVVPGADLYERSTQGMVIIFIEAISAALAASALGTFKVDSSVRVNQLSVNITT